MARNSDFVAFVLEQMAGIERLAVRAMFGGHGIYQHSCMFAIVLGDTLYFKADESTRSQFTIKGLRPFIYTARGQPVTLQYYEAPSEVFEDAESMHYWVQLAYTVAAKAQDLKANKQARKLALASAQHG